MQVVGIRHKTSRAGDPHRYIHMQIGTRVWAVGMWRALDTAALFKQQGAIRALGAAVIAAHPQLAHALEAHGLTLDPVTGEVAELEAFNPVMSKRSAQINRTLDRLETEWEVAHPGETPGPVMTARMQGIAWAYQRPRSVQLDEGQTVAAAAVASSDPLVIVEGAAGSGKTTMLRTAIQIAVEQGRASRVVAPTLRRRRSPTTNS